MSKLSDDFDVHTYCYECDIIFPTKESNDLHQKVVHKYKFNQMTDE